MINHEKAERKKYYIISSIIMVLAIACACFGAIPGLILFGGIAIFCFVIAEQAKERAERLQKDLDTMDTRDLDAEKRQAELRVQIASNERDRLNAAQHPQCSICKGFNTRKITDAERVVSVAAIGLASSKIGKQFECLDCKYKW